MAHVAAVFGLGVMLWCQSLFAQVPTLIPKLWNGEALQKDEGLFYLQAVIIDTNSQARGGSFSLVLYGKNLQTAYSMQMDTLAIGQHPERIWKLKVDDYHIAQLQLVDAKGKHWSWKGPYRHPLLVRSKSLSNGGSWYLVQLKQKNQLSLLIKSSKNVFQTHRSQGSVGSIIDAVSGREELSLVQTAASRQGEIRAVFKSQRTIGMFYKLDLFRQNQHAATVMEAIQSSDPDLRSCYTDFLDRGTMGQGTVTYTMLMSQQTHSIKTLKVKKAEILDGKFLECLYYKLLALSIPVNESMIGELSLIFQASDS